MSIAFSSCKPDACKDMTCLNGGVCESGDCLCAVGYEGLNCATEQRQAFIGNYSVTDNCNLGSFNYQISIIADSETAVEITLNNLGDFDFDIIGVVSGSSVTFTGQSGTNSTINGTGTLADGTLVINYTLTTNGGQTLTCTLTGTMID